MDAFSFSDIVSHFWTFCPFLIALVYLFSASRKRKSIPGENRYKIEGYAVEDKASCCASCGKAEIDEVKLKDCACCDLVKYCSDGCQELHRPKHAEACKQRAAELRDELLFKQPESSSFGDCPICMLPLPLVMKKSMAYDCCSKSVCKGCTVANWMQDEEMRREKLCPFCRATCPSTEEECDKLRMKRVEANDPVAIHKEGLKQYRKGEFIKAFDYWAKAVELGNVETHFRLALSYLFSHGVDEDREKGIYHLEKAAIGGHPHARHGLGLEEVKNGNYERALKHWIIAAAQGNDDSIRMLKNAFKEGDLSKEDLTSALRAHKAAVDATKSPQREAAEEWYRNKFGK